MNHRTDVLLDHEPEGLVEFSIEFVWPRGLIGIDGKECLMNFKFRWNSCKGHILLMRDAGIKVFGERDGPLDLVVSCGSSAIRLFPLPLFGSSDLPSWPLPSRLHSSGALIWIHMIKELFGA